MRAVSCCVTPSGNPSHLYVSPPSSRSGDLCVYTSYRCAYLKREVGVSSLFPSVKGKHFVSAPASASPGDLRPFHHPCKYSVLSMPSPGFTRCLLEFPWSATSMRVARGLLLTLGHSIRP